MVYKTILDDEGLFYIAPIYKLLFNKHYLNLPKDSVSFEKEMFFNTFKDFPRNSVVHEQPESRSIFRIFYDPITPGDFFNTTIK